MVTYDRTGMDEEAEERNQSAGTNGHSGLEIAPKRYTPSDDNDIMQLLNDISGTSISWRAHPPPFDVCEEVHLSAHIYHAVMLYSSP